jgi:hypothetical protein
MRRFELRDQSMIQNTRVGAGYSPSLVKNAPDFAATPGATQILAEPFALVALLCPEQVHDGICKGG